MSRETTLELIREIQKKRGAGVIAYITSIRPGLEYAGGIDFSDVRIFERHIRALLNCGHKNIDLFIFTPGGFAIVPWSLVSLVREHIGKARFGVLVPSMAMSAGTLISLGADEIVMGPSGELGPIDTQMGYGVQDVAAFFKFVTSQGLRSEKSRLEAFRLLAKNLKPIRLGIVRRVMTENERVALLLLRCRQKPLSDRLNSKIIDHLIDGIGIHGQSFRRSEARDIGISYVKNAEDFALEKAMASLFDLYESMLSLDKPFARKPGGKVKRIGDQRDFDAHGDHAMDVPVALIESTERLDLGRIAYGHRFWRDTPPRPRPPDETSVDEDEPEENDSATSYRPVISWTAGR